MGFPATKPDAVRKLRGSWKTRPATGRPMLG